MEQTEVFGRVVLAFGIGLLIGIERGWQSRDMRDGTRALGARTFSLIGLLGGALGLVGQLTTDAVPALGTIGFIALITTVYFKGLKNGGDRGATTEVAAVLTFVLGIVAVRGDMAVASASAVIVAAVLGLKKPLHRWIGRLESDELNAAIKLLVISVVVLPVLPNKEYGPGGVINPYILWWIVVVIAALSFASYTAIRLLGERAGVAAVGLLGGLVSSTATTVAFARFAKSHHSLATAATAGISLAGAVMFLRALVLTGILFRPAVDQLWIPLVSASLMSAAIAGALGLASRQQNTTSAALSLKATADVATGLKFVAAFAVIALATEFARQLLGTSGAIVASALGGLVDVDATNTTMARLGASGAAPVQEVVAAVVVATSINTLAKGGYAIAIAGRPFARLAALAFLPPLATAGLAFAVERFL